MTRVARAIMASIFLVLNPPATARAGPLEAAVAATHNGEYALAHQLLRPLAEKGDARAQFNLGYLYANGWGVQRDYAESAKWYQKAADQGLSVAQYNLGRAYSDGDGVVQDYTEAARWYQLAADQDYPAAQLSLGIAYAYGQGVPRDVVNAYMWISLSAIRGIQNKGLVELQRAMTPAQITEAQKLAREWKPKSESPKKSDNEALLGSDHHYGEIADPSVWPTSAVGAVTVALYSRRSYCTGTLVAPKLVLTAAHCLFFGKEVVSPGSVRFLAGLNRGVPAEYSVADRLFMSKEFNHGNWTLESSATDWAIIVLRNSLSTRPISVRSV
jgi:uncharacterized protein